jgi:hypothetical protein
LEEEEVTRKLYDFLRAKGWEMLSYGVPRGMKARIIHDIDSSFRSKDSIIPDIIAKKENVLLVIESKPEFSLEDITKLKNMTDGHLKYMKQIFGLSNMENLVVQKAVGFNRFKLNQDLHQVPNDFIIFLVNAPILVYGCSGTVMPSKLLDEFNVKKV